MQVCILKNVQHANLTFMNKYAQYRQQQPIMNKKIINTKKYLAVHKNMQIDAVWNVYANIYFFILI